ncbi:hypothetical protein [Actinomadura chokoriensis]|uniref:Uncharacterized protein n=1 Tax=Actinomadura chokoriensis TaxID=454156 RepID=A0ABV4R7G8_9ACTN
MPVATGPQCFLPPQQGNRRGWLADSVPPPTGTRASYTELSAARRELSISPQSARAALTRFRRAITEATP